MTREDVISWLEYLSNDARSKADGLVPTNIEIACGMAIDALKAQEPVKPIENAGFYYCGACRYAFTSARQKYCSECGRAVKWE